MSFNSGPQTFELNISILLPTISAHVLPIAQVLPSTMMTRGYLEVDLQVNTLE